MSGARGISLAAELGAHALLLFAQGRLHLLAGDLAAPHAGQFRIPVDVADVGFDAPESKRKGDQGKENLGDSLVVANDIEHAMKTLDATKANACSPLFGGGC